MQIKFKFKEFEIFLWKKDAFDCAEIRAQVFRLPVDCFNPLRHTFFRGTNSYDNYYIRVFGFADYKSELRFWKFKMAAPRWRS